MKHIDHILKQIDLKNAEDPKHTLVGEKNMAGEVLYSERMTHWLYQLTQQPSEALQIAVRANHIGRWEIQRSTYPMDRDGYLKWREDLIVHHQNLVAALMQKVGYANADIDRVKLIMGKTKIKQDPECQMYEDTICLVFLEHYFASFYSDKQIEEQKMIRIVKKTWFKMSKDGQQKALDLNFPDSVKTLISSALS